LGQKGLTVVELLIGVAVGSILIVAVFVFLGRGIGINREQFEQVLTTEDARLQLAKVSDAIREAQGADWLIAAENNSLTFYSQVDEIGGLDTVRVFLEGTNIQTVISQPGENDRVLTMARSVRNLEYERNLFTYYDRDNNIITADQASSGNVKRIGITLVIDVTPNQAPGEAVVETIVAPRSTLAGVGSLVRLWPTKLDYPADPLTGYQAEITTTNPDNGSTTVEQRDIIDINRGNLATYEEGYYTNINYQVAALGEYPAGWYAWIGPIFLGEYGGSPMEITDKVPISQLCTGADIENMVATCPDRTVSIGPISKTYKPILTYVSDGGALDYVREIAFNYTTPSGSGNEVFGPFLAGPNNPGTVLNDVSEGSGAWSGVENVATSNNVYATASLGGLLSSGTNYLKATNFGFNIPADATITGIVVQWEKRSSDIEDAAVRIVKNDVIGNTDKSIGAWPSEGYVSHGGLTDLWGETWTPADINSPGFGAAIRAAEGECGGFLQSCTAYLDHVRIAVYYTTTQYPSPTPTPSPTPSATPSPTSTITPTPTTTPSNFAGPNSPASVTSDSSIGTIVWSSPNNATASDDLRSTVSLDPLSTSQYLRATNFGFSVPAGATINGITAEMEKSFGSGTQCKGDAGDNAVRIIKGGSIGSTDKSGTIWSTSSTDEYISYGGSSDTWGEVWTPADINGANFGVAISAVETGDEDCTVRVDHVRLTVHYTQ